MKRNRIRTFCNKLPRLALSRALVPALAFILVLATAHRGGAILADTDISVSNSSVEIVANGCDTSESLVEMHFQFTLTPGLHQTCDSESPDNPLTTEHLAVTLHTPSHDQTIVFPITVGPSGNNGQSDGTLTIPAGAVSDANIEMLGGKACQRFNFNADVGAVPLASIVSDLEGGAVLSLRISAGNDTSVYTAVQHVELHTPSCPI